MPLSPGGWVSLGHPSAYIWMRGGEWKKGLWRDLCVEPRIKLVIQGVGAHPWILERRNGLARGIYNRLKEARHYTGP